MRLNSLSPATHQYAIDIEWAVYKYHSDKWLSFMQMQREKGCNSAYPYICQKGMKIDEKTILCKLSLIVLAALLINGCGKETDDVENANEVIFSDMYADIEEADEDINVHYSQESGHNI